VYACTDTLSASVNGPNPAGYVAVELHNPYPYDLPLNNYQLGVIDRSPQPRGVPQRLRIKPLTGSPAARATTTTWQPSASCCMNGSAPISVTARASATSATAAG
jgi:hypothetical protein